MQSREKITFKKKSGESKLRDTILFVLIFILSIATIVTMQIRSNKNEKTDSINAESVNVLSEEKKIKTDNLTSDYTSDNDSMDFINDSPKGEAIKNEEIKKEYIYVFEKPVDGKIIKDFSDNELIYSQTMDDWRLHLGSDISSSIGENVFASEKGVVDDLYKDENYGYTVVIKHNDSIKTLYSNLSSNTTLAKGDMVNKGDVIGVIGDSALSEILDESHLHFAIKENDVFINPRKYIKNM